MTTVNPKLKHILQAARMEKQPQSRYHTYNHYSQAIRSLDLTPRECEVALRQLADILHV